MKRTNKKGFTLIELLIVVAIMAIIAAVAVPAIMGASNSGKQKSFETEAGNVKQAIVDAAQNISFDAETGVIGKATKDLMATKVNAALHPTYVTKATVTYGANGYSIKVEGASDLDPVTFVVGDLKLYHGTTEPDAIGAAFTGTDDTMVFTSGAGSSNTWTVETTGA